MNARINRCWAWIVVAMAVCAGNDVVTALGEIGISLEQVPPAVRDTILREADGATITEVEQETKDGQVIYEAEFVQDGHEVEIAIAADGTLLGKEMELEEDDEDDLTINQVPAAARAVLMQHAAGATITKVERETEFGVTVYEAVWQVNGSKHEAAATADGTLLEIGETVSIERVPPAVRAAIATKVGAGQTVAIEKKMIVVYEVEAKIHGRETEFYVVPTGRVHENGLDDGDDDSDDDANDADD